jgi:hypothetical protein
MGRAFFPLENVELFIWMGIRNFRKEQIERGKERDTRSIVSFSHKIYSAYYKM